VRSDVEVRDRPHTLRADRVHLDGLPLERRAERLRVRYAEHDDVGLDLIRIEDAIALHIVPLGRKTAASWPSRSATRSHSAITVGSANDCSSPTSASAIARRMAGVGRVWVSE
jgi:hypothetical protein